MEFSLTGIPEISKVYMSCPDPKKDKDDVKGTRVIINANGAFERKFGEWYFQTDGSNLLEVLRCDC
jgi:hypothetical protein